MTGLVFKELWGRKRRMVGSLLAVFLGVTFLTGTLVLGDTLAGSIDGYYSKAFGRTDVSVRNSTSVSDEPWGSRGQIDASVLDQVRRVDGVANAEPVIEGSGQLLAKDGTIVESRGPRRAGNWLTDPKLNPYRLAEGRAPRAPNEVVINKMFADEGKLKVGDRTAVLMPEKVPVTVVGISMFGDEEAFGETSFTAFSLEGARTYVAKASGRITGVSVRAEDGVGQDALAARIKPVLPAGTEAVTNEAQVEEGMSKIESGFLQVFRTVLGAFGGVALLVAAFSIHNTFAITMAQRTRESALLRALGAGRRQVMTIVGFEALVIGAAATLAGLGGGLGFAQLLRWLFMELRIGIAMEGLTVSATSLMIAVPVGLLVTLVAALGPAVKASRVAPLAALREVAAESARPSDTRVIVGAVLGAVAAGTVLFGALTEQPAMAGAGAILCVVAMVALGPVVARPVAALIGGPAARARGVSGTLARDNASRSPKRTAGAATALMIGVGVVTLMTVFIGSLGASLENSVAGSFKGPLVVNAGNNQTGGFSTGLARDAEKLPQVERVAGAGTGSLRVDGDASTVSVADPSALGRVLDLDVTKGAMADAGTFAVSTSVADDKNWRVGSQVPVTFADGTSQRLTVGAVYDNTDMTGDYLVPRTVWDAHDSQPLDTRAFVVLRDGASVTDAKRALTALVEPYGAPDVQTTDEFVTAQTEEAQGFISVVYGMLILAIVIALLGIANTLSLAVHERTRELGLLRAVGATRPQIRSMVRWESVIVAVFGTGGGLGLGLFLGWGLGGSLGNPFAPPVVTLVVVALVGAVAGALAAIRPARRAARLAILSAISTP
ncbi:putative ABC transport system permease protein [Actinomadura pelletieri DSM 43383]|uniref:Putative ABC transport system permease protein n=1 Tax=Actinomadura pelletieri DSM 43383 TaxID=1120940 RepID=A0A495QAF8_9ACTN|nr:FtsX-like permease family protein [Actinomadura pelletieri]RKS68645.1 putative ABC transport system permease protein [Actinomadura pelletieri DSM 43383]